MTSATGGSTVCEVLADYTVGLRYEDVPADVIARAKEHLVHLLGNALRGQGSTIGDAAVRTATALTGRTGRCTIIGDVRRAHELDAVFANSMLMSTDGLEDVVFPPGVHPGIVTQPVGWAFGEVGRVTGRELILAVIIGYDVMTKLCGSVWTWTLDPPRRPNAVVGPFGAAATAARLLRLSKSEAAYAFGHAGQAGMGVVEGSGHMGTASPLLARNGAMAAVMAASGLESSLTVVEGRNGVYNTFFRQDVSSDLHDVLGTLGQQFEMRRASIKRLPGSFFNVVPLELAQDLVDEHRPDPGSVEEIVVTLPAERTEREAAWEGDVLRPEATPTNRVGSLRYRIALIVRDGRSVPSGWDAPPDEDLLALLAKVRLAFEERRPLAYARIDVTMASGATWSTEGEQPAPTHVDRLDWLAVGGDGRLPDEQLTRLVALVDHLEEVEDISEVLACTVPTPARVNRDAAELRPGRSTT